MIDLSEVKIEHHPDMGLDIRELHRTGSLYTTYEGFRNLIVHGRYHRVFFQKEEGDRLHIRSKVHLGCSPQIVWTGCNYGGGRPWFVCPDCDMRAAILYSPHEDFVCRTCAGVFYPTTVTDDLGRLAARAKKLKKKLGWTKGGILGGYGSKPKGMHWKTFERLQQAYKTEEFNCNLSTAKLLGMEVSCNDPMGRPVYLPGRNPWARK